MANDYHMERRCYADPLLRQCLPRLAHDCCGRAARGDGGYEFPPHLIVERGVPLTQWLQTRRSERAVLRMATGVLATLCVLHGGGRAHRNIHPGDVLHITHTERWCLQGLGSVAAIGAPTCMAPCNAALARFEDERSTHTCCAHLIARLLQLWAHLRVRAQGRSRSPQGTARTWRRRRCAHKLWGTTCPCARPSICGRWA